MMVNVMMVNTMLMSRMMAEDCGTPELRDSRTGGMRYRKSFFAFFKRSARA